MENGVSLKEFTEEIIAMLETCFEGKTSKSENGLLLHLESGETFVLKLEKK